ncbi:MAG: tRNA (adenosine(37)-N6)-threonylcarbamoyltransferase complex dimerization subunit type 1 TsaB [Alphaproteobacteria bacterium]|nr:MAG: tRNA (adenosine(37)-N6)-threonylcarbamoyltransferase complex dimerization subunit type 1 TsaB [Candidatus Marinimicrobia bacterium TMED108]
MKFLCLDTTLNNCSIHIVSPGKECLTVSDNHVPPSDVIPILVKKAMLKLNLKISDIDGIIVATGPGNFTSLRVGISFGVGLSKSLSIPIYGVSSLQSLVFSFREEIKKNENFLVTIKARGEDYFFQLFDNKAKPSAEAVKANIFYAQELFANYNLSFIGDGSLDIAIKLGKKENIICNNNDIDFLKVFENMNKNILKYKDNVWPLYLAEPVAEKKDPQWFAKKEK